MADKKPRPQANVTVIGRLGSEPGPVSASGKLTKARLAVGQRVKDKSGEWADGPTMWFDVVTAGPQLADLHKGDLVELQGRLGMREWEDREKVKRYSYEVWVNRAANVGNSLDDSEFPVGA